MKKDYNYDIDLRFFFMSIATAFDFINDESMFFVLTPLWYRAFTLDGRPTGNPLDNIFDTYACTYNKSFTSGDFTYFGSENNRNVLSALNAQSLRVIPGSIIVSYTNKSSEYNYYGLSNKIEAYIHDIKDCHCGVLLLNNAREINLIFHYYGYFMNFIKHEIANPIDTVDNDEKLGKVLSNIERRII